MARKNQKVIEWFNDLSSWIWCEIVDPHLIPIYKNGKYTGILKKKWDFYILYWCLSYPLDLLNTILYRIFIRGNCALRGCELSYYNFNLPDGCYEWCCNNCCASGIDWVVQTVDKFEKDTPLQNFIEALKGK